MDAKSSRKQVLDQVRKNGSDIRLANPIFKNDKEIVLAAIKQYPNAFYHVHKDMKDDFEVVMSAVSESGSMLMYVSERLRSNITVVEAALNNFGRALEYVLEPLKSNKEIVTLALKKSGLAIEFASNEFKNDQDLVTIALENNGCAIKFLDQSFKKNREYVIKAVKSNGLALEFVDETFKDDEEIVMAAINKSGHAIKFSSDRFRRNLELIKKVLEKGTEYLGSIDEDMILTKPVLLMKNGVTDDTYNYLSDELKNDSEVIKNLVRYRDYAFHSIPDKFKKNIDFISELIVKVNERVIEQIDDKILYNKSLLAVLIESKFERFSYYIEYNKLPIIFKKDPYILSLDYASKRSRDVWQIFKDDDELIRKYIDHSNYASLFRNNAGYIFEKYSNDYSVMLAMVGLLDEYTNSHLKKIGNELLNNIDFISKAVSKNPYILNYTKYSSDAHFMINLIKFDQQMFNYAHEILLDNEEFVSQCLPFIEDKGLLSLISPRLKQIRDFILPLVSVRGYELRFAGSLLQDDYDIVLAAIKSSSNAIEYASERHRNNRDLVIESIKRFPSYTRVDLSKFSADKSLFKEILSFNGEFIQHASEELRNDLELAQIAIESNVKSFIYFGQSLKSNYDFVLTNIQRNAAIIAQMDDEIKNNLNMLSHIIAKNINAIDWIESEYITDELLDKVTNLMILDDKSDSIFNESPSKLSIHETCRIHSIKHKFEQFLVIKMKLSENPADEAEIMLEESDYDYEKDVISYDVLSNNIPISKEYFVVTLYGSTTKKMIPSIVTVKNHKVIGNDIYLLIENNSKSYSFYNEYMTRLLDLYQYKLEKYFKIKRNK